MSFALLMTVALVMPAQAQVRGDVAEIGYDTDVSTRAFEVLDLDFDGGRVLFRHVYQLTGDDSRGLAPGVDCGYDGLPPGVGEVLGVYDLRRDTYDVVFPLRAPVRSPDACTSPEETALVQQTAADQLRRLGLDPNARPQGVPPAAEGEFFSVLVAERKERTALRVESRRAADPDRTLVPRVGELLDGGQRVALARLEAQGRVLYTRYQVLDDAQDVGRELTFLQLFLDAKSQRAVLLERYYHRPRGQAPEALFSFSPVLDLVALLDGLDDLPEDKVATKRSKRRKKKRPNRPKKSGQDETCSESCCSCGCMACLAPVVGGACGCALCFDGCANLERKLFGDDDDTYDGDDPYEEIPPDDPDDDDGTDDDEEEDSQYIFAPGSRGPNLGFAAVARRVRY